MLSCAHCSDVVRLDLTDFYPKMRFGMSAMEARLLNYATTKALAEKWETKLPIASEVKNYESTYWWHKLVSGLIEQGRFTLVSPSFIFTFCAKGSADDKYSEWANVVFFFHKPSGYDKEKPPSPKFVGTSVRFAGLKAGAGRTVIEKLGGFFGISPDKFRFISGTWAPAWASKEPAYGFSEQVLVGGRRAILQATLKVADKARRPNEIHVDLTDEDFLPEY
ncbi:hypothetical protein M427DRAFT_421407 [Gonapodya prolifera JEL478]|uniref:Uncharacterized protein n=1 Tax=Gonapodya prolifera (strain JEL478) TaxID=1344416 RepID=A0A139A4K4_GONPJ|nr:hypothetical protein M427DRAFT_421407 [Gonapodya prolifera JEL478]|eukprot:KXS11720.1 hypothetical protein M427DRAFT_421407 [Gonapodya prolifera JEL478]